MYMNITFDLETLGTNMNAPIAQIGAVKFKDSGEIVEEFLSTIDLQSLDEYDFKLDYATLDWWFRQDPRAIESVYRLDKGNTEDLRSALIRFRNWVGDPSKYVYWSHANFDAPILENAYQKVGVKPPFLRRRQRDIRTLCHFTGEVNVERYGIYHNALDDAITQAKYISLRLGMLPSLGSQEGSILKPHSDEV